MTTEIKTSQELLEEMRGPVMWLTVSREEKRNSIGPDVLAGLFVLTDDATGGQLAFREKRKPVWAGR